MVTKRELKKDIYELLDICVELDTMLGFYRAKVEDDAATIKKLRRELKIAKRNEPIFTSDKYELKELREKVQKAEEEAAHYKAYSEARRESNDALRIQIDRLKKELEKARKSDKQNSKTNNG